MYLSPTDLLPAITISRLRPVKAGNLSDPTDRALTLPNLNTQSVKVLMLRTKQTTCKTSEVIHCQIVTIRLFTTLGKASPKPDLGPAVKEPLDQGTTTRRKSVLRHTLGSSSANFRIELRALRFRKYGIAILVRFLRATPATIYAARCTIKDNEMVAFTSTESITITHSTLEVGDGGVLPFCAKPKGNFGRHFVPPAPQFTGLRIAMNLRMFIFQCRWWNRHLAALLGNAKPRC
jgi:hypothetical protein